MSAIAGIIGNHITEKDARLIDAMCDIQKHRGRDGHGTVLLPGACLGERHFHIGWQPAAVGGVPPVSETEQAAAVFDGMLFNQAQLRGELDGRDTAVRRETDASTVLRSYLKWGEECTLHLDGLFSFAVWDWKNRTLFAARDRIGEKPFFYHHDQRGDLIFASEIKALLKTGRISRDIDHEAVYQYLYEKGFLQPRTPLLGVKSLMPGHSLVWREGRVTIRKYWDLTYSDEEVSDDGFVIATLRDILCRAVSERAGSENRLGLLFSGGMDSSVVLGALAQATEGAIKTYTVTTGLRSEQIDLSRSLASHFKAEHTEIVITPQLVAEHLLDFVWHLYNPTVGSTHIYFGTKAAHRDGVRIVFSGFYADGVFLTFWILRYALPAEKILAPLRIIPERARVAAYDLAERILRGPGEERHGGIQRLVNILYLYVRRKRGLYRWYMSGLHPGYIASLFSSDVSRNGWMSPADAYRGFFHQCPSSSLYDRCMYTELKTGIGINALTNYESLAAAHSVQMQTPFVDQQLVEFAQRVPYRIKRKDGDGKHIPRELCKALVTPECASQSKAAYNPPFDTWLRGTLWPVAENVFSRESVNRRGIFAYGKIKELCDHYRSGTTKLQWVDIWAFIVLELWFRTHIDPSPDELAEPSDNWIPELLKGQ